MSLVRRRYVVASLLAIACALAPIPGEAETWGCYDPEPGHPTAAEKVAFVQDIELAARDAERRFGVPAPAIAAMSILESGYGFTRTALEANNLFGFKWISEASAGGRTYYELACQPEWDPGKRYIKFENRASGMAFVAQRLSNSKYYRGSTNAFKEAMGRGDSRKQAIIAWVRGISKSYNYKPDAYVRSVVRLMNDPIDPSDNQNADRSLFRWQ